MKKKMRIIKALILGAILATTGITGTGIGTPRTVYAQPAAAEQKTAGRNEVNISVNGGAVVKIVAYNIEGYNYFRVADICKVLNMKVFRYVTDFSDGIKVVSNEPFDGTVEKALDDKALAVTVKEIIVYYDSGYTMAKSFNHAGRNYIKLADIVAAANNNNEVNIESVKNAAEKGIGQAIDTRPTTIDLETSYDSATNTISIMTSKTDFQKMYVNLYSEKQGETPEEFYEEKTVEPSKATAQPELTSTPEVGAIPAKILKDESQPAYVDGKVNLSNFTSPYAKGSIGGCVWYALGRFEEVTGVVYPYILGVYDLNEVSQDTTLQVIIDPNKIVARSIAVFGKEHVLFVEYIERDSNGNPKNIYFTENGYGNGGKHVPGLDGKVQKLEFNKFINRQAEYKGCITVK